MEYTIGKDPGRPAQPAPYRLLTTILDPAKAPAAELAALYHQRWEFETTLDELKTHQRGPKVVLRSRSPEMVAQEVWGMLLVHHAIRRLMHQAALDHRPRPRPAVLHPHPARSSAARSPPPARRPFPPEPTARTLARVTAEIAERLLPSRRLRAFPRVVKRKMSNFGVKRAQPSCLAPADPARRRGGRHRRGVQAEHPSVGHRRTTAASQSPPTSTEPAEPT